MKRRTRTLLAAMLCAGGLLTGAQQSLSQTQPQPQQAQATSAPCTAPKKPSRWDGIKQRAKHSFEATAQAQVDKAGGVISKDTHRNADGTLIPSVSDIANGGQTQTKPCVASAQGNSTH